MSNINDFASYLKDLRIKAGYDTIDDLAKKCKISSASLCRMENNKQKPGPSTLQKLAPHLGVTYSSLMSAIGYLKDEETGAFISVIGSGGKKLDITDLPEEDQQAIFAMAEYYKNKKRSGKNGKAKKQR